MMKFLLVFAIAGLGTTGIIANRNLTDEGRDALLFKRFENKFKEAALPYEINIPSAAYYSESTMGPEAEKFVPEMTYSKFSRRTRSNATYNAKLMETDKFTLLVYSVEEMVSDTLSPVRTIMASYDSSGHRIDYIEFACQCSAKQYKTGRMDASHTIAVKEYRNKWLYDPGKEGYAQNEVTGNELINTTIYIVDKNGYFHRTRT